MLYSLTYREHKCLRKDSGLAAADLSGGNSRPLTLMILYGTSASKAHKPRVVRWYQNQTSQPSLLVKSSSFSFQMVGSAKCNDIFLVA